MRKQFHVHVVRGAVASWFHRWKCWADNWLDSQNSQRWGQWTQHHLSAHTLFLLYVLQMWIQLFFSASFWWTFCYAIDVFLVVKTSAGIRCFLQFIITIHYRQGFISQVSHRSSLHCLLHVQSNHFQTHFVTVLWKFSDISPRFLHQREGIKKKKAWRHRAAERVMFSVSWLVSLPLFLQHHYPLPHDNMGSGCAAVCWRSGHALLSVHFWVRLFVLLVCLYFFYEVISTALRMTDVQERF